MTTPRLTLSGPIVLVPETRRSLPAPAIVAAGAPARVIDIDSEEDLVAAVRQARQRGETVRAFGSEGSKNECCRTTGTALRLTAYDRVVALEGNAVTIQAGATVAALNAALRRHGLALPTHGEWAGATVAGALATGTHGGSAAHGLFATSVRSIRLITAAGQPVEVHRGSELFEHAAVSLGLLGVFSTVTFECLPAFHLEMVTRVVPFERYLSDHDAESRAHEFYTAVWIPTARRVITFAADRVAPPVRPRQRRERFCPTTFLLAALSRRAHFHFVPRQWFETRAVDAADQMISPIRNGSRRVHLLRFLSRGWKAAEFAVPLSDASDTLVALDRFLAGHRHALTNPVGLRATAADGFSLSPCSGRAMYWVDLFFRDANGFAPELRGFFEERGARCHWGKHIGLSREHLRGQYPRWEAFRAARAALDPDNLFANDFTRRLGL